MACACIRSLISTGRRNQDWCWRRTQQLNYAVESSRVRFKFHCCFSSFPAASVLRSAATWSDHVKGFRSWRKASISDISWSSTKYTGLTRLAVWHCLSLLNAHFSLFTSNSCPFVFYLKPRFKQKTLKCICCLLSCSFTFSVGIWSWKRPRNNHCLVVESQVTRFDWHFA